MWTNACKLTEPGSSRRGAGRRYGCAPEAESSDVPAGDLGGADRLPRAERPGRHGLRRRRRGGAAPGPADLPAAPALRDLPAEPLLRDLPAEPPAQPARPDRERLFGSDCDTEIAGSRVTAHCHNPYPRTDLVALHVECDRWWDVDGDTVAVPVGPAGRVELTSRCWKEVRSAWVSHRPG